jgi:glutamyl-tRNA synthetase
MNDREAIDIDLVDRWFPAGLPELQHWETYFAPRRLPPDAEVTRFAPSPTGSMHLGGLYVAALARESARAGGGVYLVRIEDTDKRREVAGAEAEFEQVFAYFGLTADEGAGAGGAHGPYRQSEREEIYLSHARELVRKGLAYPCFCSADDLARGTAEQQASRSPIGYYGKWAPCRGLSTAEAGRRIAAGESFTVRLRCQVGLPGRVRFRDRIRGALTMLDNGNDVVILKSAESGVRLPTYHFAHVVDDHLMGVTLVIRGEEWISSLPVHRQLHEALGFTPPAYAHIAPLMKVDGGNRRKLSKRKDPESAAAFYVAAGYPAPAVLHYLRGLANSRLMELPTREALAEPVRLAEAGLSGPLVDLARLRSLSRDHIASLEPRAALAGLRDWAAAHDPGLAGVLARNEGAALAAFEIARRGSGTPRKDLACWSEFREAYGFCFPELYTPVVSPGDERFGGLAPELVARVAADLAAEPLLAERRLDPLRDLAERHGFAPDTRSYRAAPERYRGSVSDVANVLRVCVTGRRHSPDLFQILTALGEPEIHRRLSPLASHVEPPLCV